MGEDIEEYIAKYTNFCYYLNLTLYTTIKIFPQIYLIIKQKAYTGTVLLPIAATF